MDRLKAIQNSTIGMSKSDFDSAKFAVINDLTKLQFDFNSYMDGTETNDTMTTPVSGKSKIKSHKINLFTAIVEDLKKCEQPFNCPHGRPTMICISDEQLVKEFNR